MEYVIYLLATFAVLSFFVGLALAFQPTLVNPTSLVRIKGIDKHDKSVYIAFGTSSLAILAIISIPFVTFIYSSFGWLSVCFLLFLVYPLAFIYASMNLLLETLHKIIKRHSIRSLHCQKCKKPLKKSDSIIDFLNRKEQVALQLGSIDFELWYCKTCCTEHIRDFVHLRLYIDSSDKFQACPSCDEVIMIKTSSSVIQQPTTATEGQRLVIYTCQYCGREEKKVNVIPRISESGSGGGDGGGDGGGGG